MGTPKTARVDIDASSPLNLAKERSLTKIKKLAGKRSAQHSPKNNHEGDTNKINVLINELETTAEELMNLTKTTTNTKNEIKNLAKKLYNISGRIVDAKYEIEELHEETQRNKRTKSIENTQNLLEEGAFTCIECKKKVENEEERMKKLEEEIGAAQNMDNNEEYISKVKTLAGNKWAEILYKKTKLKKGLREGPNQNMVVIVGRGGERSNLIQILRGRFPEIEEFVAAEDVLQYSESSTTTNKGKTSKRKLHVIKSMKEEEIIGSLKSICEKEEEGDLDIACTEGPNWTTLRKQIEIVFRQSKLEEVSLVVPQNHEQRMGGKLVASREGEKKSGIISITMKEEFQNQDKMEEVIRNMKKNIDIEEIGVNVEGPLRYKDGVCDIKAVEKKTGGLVDFLKKVTNSVQDKATVKSKSYGRKNKTLVIRNIDISNTSTEVLNAVKSRVPDDKCLDIKIKSLKPNYRKDSLVGILETTEEVADIILQGKTVKVGWVQCSVDLMITPVQCFKCLCHGHLGKDCSSKTQRGTVKCRKCLKEGHLAKDCQNEAVCADCGERHSAGNMACKVYRDLVNKGRKRDEGWESERRRR
uniref:CCHC-type domain-containing protein n=1 Tax=Cacopsylla melanoneura TaxID=428564 RepID=A0A8D8QNK5_9HEMI